MRATWAPKGQTPVLTHHFNWKRLSMSAAVCFRPDGSGASLVFGMQPGAYNDESLMEFLDHHLLFVLTNAAGSPLRVAASASMSSGVSHPIEHQ